MNINNTTIKRIASDVKFLLKNEKIINDENIYYKHSTTNLLIGYALIIGNKDTPYKNGFYLFKFNFPDNYPFSPPLVTFLSNDGKMRFNPNYYTCGKVCLSLLNTWKGDGWTSCQTIYSILIVLANVFNSNPLLNEPGININDPNLEKYNFLVEYKNYQFSIIEQLKYLKKFSNIDKEDTEDIEHNNNSNSNKVNYSNIIIKFQEIFKKFLNKNKETITNDILLLENKAKNFTNNENRIYINIYNINDIINFEKIKKDFNNILNDTFYKIE